MADTDFDVSPFKDRLEGYAKANYKSFREFEDKCGLVHAGISAIGKQGPTLSYLAKIADAIPELNMNWLISGKGPIELSEPSDCSNKRAAPSVNVGTAQAVFITNWKDIEGLVERTIERSMAKHIEEIEQ